MLVCQKTETGGCLTGIVISVMLAVPDAPAAAAWYRDALGATELWSLDPVVGLEIHGAPFFLAQPSNNEWDSPSTIGTTTVRVDVFLDDPDAFINRALDAGTKGNADGTQDHHMPWG